MWGWIMGIAGALVTFMLQQRLASAPKGTTADPLPALNQPTGEPVYPDVTTVDAETVYQTINGLIDTPLTRAQAVPLIGQFLLATKRGTQVTGNNPVHMGAGPEWEGPWTMVRSATAVDGQLRHRERAIRVYPTIRLGVADWLNELPEDAWDVILAGGDVDAFSTALYDSGALTTPPTMYADYLIEITDENWKTTE